MDRKKEFAKLLQTFLRVGSKFSEHGNTTHEYGTGVPIYSSEIHTIEVIGLQGQINVTELAAALGITKGAVSQVIRKLENKRLVRRSSDSSDKKLVIIHLTEKGETASRNHALFHEKQYAFLLEYLNRLNDSEMRTVTGLFDAIERSFER